MLNGKRSPSIDRGTRPPAASTGECGHRPQLQGNAATDRICNAVAAAGGRGALGQASAFGAPGEFLGDNREDSGSEWSFNAIFEKFVEIGVGADSDAADVGEAIF